MPATATSERPVASPATVGPTAYPADVTADATPVTTTVLIVEDDADIALTLKRMLERQGYQVTWADTGQKGLAEIRRSPHVVLLDLGLRTWTASTCAARPATRGTTAAS